MEHKTICPHVKKRQGGLLQRGCRNSILPWKTGEKNLDPYPEDKVERASLIYF